MGYLWHKQILWVNIYGSIVRIPMCRKGRIGNEDGSLGLNLASHQLLCSVSAAPPVDIENPVYTHQTTSLPSQPTPSNSSRNSSASPPHPHPHPRSCSANHPGPSSQPHAARTAASSHTVASHSRLPAPTASRRKGSGKAGKLALRVRDPRPRGGSGRGLEVRRRGRRW